MEASLPRRAFAEAIGVFILCTIGNGSVAELVVAGSGTWLGINLCYGIAVALAVYVCGKVSGGHVNPAVTIVEAVEGRLGIKEAAFYILGQMIGGFASGGAVYVLYADMEKTEKTSGIFATYPRSDISMAQAFANEVIGTLFLLLFVRSVTDKNNNGAPSGLEPFFIGGIVFAIGAALGVNTGYALNPARDLGPRLFTFVAGFPTVFTRGNNAYDCHFWIPIVGPIVGAVLGSKLYSVSIGSELERQQVSMSEGTYRKVSDSRQDDETKINEETDI